MLPERRRAGGFTLIELMIVVAIISILATIAIPKFAALVVRSKEGATRGSLGAIRSALSIYYADQSGTFPGSLADLTPGGHYLNEIPRAKTPNFHPDTAVESDGSASAVLTDIGGWAYVNDATDLLVGTVWVNCTHTDSKGTSWPSY